MGQPHLYEIIRRAKTSRFLAKVKIPVEDILAQTEVTEEDKENLTDISN